MSAKERAGLTPEELEEMTAEVVPQREAMTLIQPVAPIGGGFTLPAEPPQAESQEDA